MSFREESFNRNKCSYVCSLAFLADCHYKNVALAVVLCFVAVLATIIIIIIYDLLFLLLLLLLGIDVIKRAEQNL